MPTINRKTTSQFNVQNDSAVFKTPFEPSPQGNFQNHIPHTFEHTLKFFLKLILDLFVDTPKQASTLPAVPLEQSNTEKSPKHIQFKIPRKPNSKPVQNKRSAEDQAEFSIEKTLKKPSTSVSTGCTQFFQAMDVTDKENKIVNENTKIPVNDTVKEMTDMVVQSEQRDTPLPQVRLNLYIWCTSIMILLL